MDRRSPQLGNFRPGSWRPKAHHLRFYSRGSRPSACSRRWIGDRAPSRPKAPYQPQGSWQWAKGHTVFPVSHLNVNSPYNRFPSVPFGRRVCLGELSRAEVHRGPQPSDSAFFRRRRGEDEAGRQQRVRVWYVIGFSVTAAKTQRVKGRQGRIAKSWAV